MDDGAGPRHPAWSLRDFRIQSLGSGERTVVWTGGSAARYVQTGYLIHAQGNSLFAIPFDLDTMETTASPVAEEGGYHFPDSWFGTTLAFRRELSPVGSPDNTANEMDIWTMSVDGGTPGEPQPFRAEPVLQEGGAAFSRDGRWVAYQSGVATPLDFRVYVEPFPPTGERRLVSREQEIMPLWSRSGRELFYRTVNQTGTAPQTLRKIDVSTSPSFTFTSEEAVAIGRFMSFGYYRSFDVTPDGEHFLVVLPERTELEPERLRVDIVVNWFQELTRLVPTP